jgi:hypothetical protein
MAEEQRLMQTLQDARPGLDDALREMVESGTYRREEPPPPVDTYTGWHPLPTVVIPDTLADDSDAASIGSDIEELLEETPPPQEKIPEEERGTVIGIRSRPNTFLISAVKKQLPESKGQRENRIRESKYFTKRKILPPRWTMRERQVGYFPGQGRTGPYFGDNVPMYKYYFVDPYGVAQNHPPDGYNHPVDQDIFIPKNFGKKRKTRKHKRKSRKHKRKSRKHKRKSRKHKRKSRKHKRKSHRR